MAGSRDDKIYKRPYVRPNENWVCGRSAEGKPCPHGPSRRGKCNRNYECVPAQIGDRWVCTRPDQYGGSCDSPTLESPSFGPRIENGKGVCCRQVHCTPERSLRSRRGVYSLLASCLVAGVLLIAVGGPWRDQAFSPGPLTIHHQGASMASLESLEEGKLGADPQDTRGNDESCGICHTALDDGLAGMLSSTAHHATPVKQSAQCLTCHQEDLGENPLMAHALSPELLAQHTAEANEEPFSARKPLSLLLASFSPGVKTTQDGELACATCHQEHNGAFFDLTRMSNTSCQTCHVKQFKGAANGHPEFSTLASAAAYDYPYRRRTRIVYDHARHETNYFNMDENRSRAPGSCADCHHVDAGSGTTRLVPFEQMCASCHTNNIVSARDEWIHVFGFPSLESDVYEILENELETKAVPRTATKSLPPFMLMLLSGLKHDNADETAVFNADLAKVLEFEGDLSGIAYDDDPEIVARLMEGMKSVRNAAMNSDAGGMRQAFHDLLQRAGAQGLDTRQLDALLGAPKPGESIEKFEESAERKDIVEMGGWHVKDSGYRFDPASWAMTIASVEAYATAKEAGEAGAAFDMFAVFTDFRDWFDERVLISDGTWLRKDSGEELKAKDWTELTAALVVAADSQPENTDPPADDAAAAPVTAFDAWFADFSAVKRWFDDTIDMSAGAWALRGPKSLYYRPVQHADPFMTAWLDLTGPLYGTNPAAAIVFDQLSGRATGAAAGSCTKCHSIDAETTLQGAKVVRVNWESQPASRDFTKFNHAPHLKLMNCAECHRAPWVATAAQRVQVAAASAEEEVPAESPAVTDEVEAPEATVETPADASEAPSEAVAPEAPPEPEVPKMAYLDSFKASSDSQEIGVDFLNRGSAPEALAFVSNFEPVKKADCVRCHAPGKAGDNCLICHNYHIEPSNRSAGIRSLRDLLTKTEEKTSAADSAPADEAPAEEAQDAPDPASDDSVVDSAPEAEAPAAE